VDAVYENFAHPVTCREFTINRVQPGFKHGMHVDWQSRGFLTRVHLVFDVFRQ